MVEDRKVKWRSALIDTLVNTLYEGYDIISDQAATAVSTALLALGVTAVTPQVIEETLDQYVIGKVRDFIVERLPEMYERMGEYWSSEERARRKAAYDIGYGIERLEVIPGTDYVPGSLIGELILYGRLYAPALIERIRRRVRGQVRDDLRRGGVRVAYT